MKLDSEKIAENFLEFSSEQRLKIIFKLLNEKSSLSSIAKSIGASAPEVHRNLNRLLKNGLLKKDSDGNFELTTYGKTICVQIPAVVFVGDNKEFFETHDFGNTPSKFIQRIGALQQAKHIKGFVKVLEQWKKIHVNAEKYIYNILAEVPYTEDIINTVESKLKKGINIRSIFTENAIIPEKRETVFEEKNFQKFIKNEMLQRKMNKNISTITLLNEKEACVLFSKNEGEFDMGEMFYSNDVDFHDWCLDFFNYNWETSSVFQEQKLVK